MMRTSIFKGLGAASLSLYLALWVTSSSAKRFLLWLFFPVVITHLWLDYLQAAFFYQLEMKEFERTGVSRRPYRCAFCGRPTNQPPYKLDPSFCVDCIEKAHPVTEEE